MADITLQHITPRHFYESVKLIKEIYPHFEFSHNALTISFDSDENLFERIEHLEMFLKELEHSSVPVDLSEFVRTYRKIPKNRTYFKR
ncbi:hypothetical protein [Pasteurella canis]|uniref:hypothetical protein n=1 Tax=Pasteurella canis TaxID=753 RepID=UPI001E518ADD|nr:hypothetical protein [Pasteurella canis]UEC23920.1 hypothetical protein K7G93_000687 [Pasteurella canis]UEC23929.1 hypothetical protein K7G93_000697 [Pasteurella canis]UEC23938.1 hypothetical protein K7G93_000707 [Pasteurella canis]UEC23947.1 hypothetical protein K7G93_000717 [Pasteurella canis]